MPPKKKLTEKQTIASEATFKKAVDTKKQNLESKQQLKKQYGIDSRSDSSDS